MTLESRHHKMVDVNSCVQHLKELLVDCDDIEGIENPTPEDFEQCAREWWAGE